MPASLRANVSRAVSSSRPYDRERRSPAASSAHSGSPRLSRTAPPPSPVQTPNSDSPDADTDAEPEPEIPPDLPGLPTYAEYKRIESGYLHGLSPRKRDKALITQAMFDKIWDVLHQPDACTVETPQFRFWVRKMFTLSRPAGEGGNGRSGWVDERSEADADEADLELERSMGIGLGRTPADTIALDSTAVVLHENRPVAIMEQLYELFCYCHVRAGHGGRDKTCAVIREHYSWVPKELTAQFVKACPTCVLKRSGQGADVGVFASQRRVGRRGGRKGRVAVLDVEPGESSVSVGTWSLGFPTTGGPLDPEPCGLLERERKRTWLRARGDVDTLGQSRGPSNSSPARTVPSEATFHPAGGWSNAPRALTLNDSPFTTRSASEPFSANNGTVRQEREMLDCSPTKVRLRSLSSALSNESLDDRANSSGDAPDSLSFQPLRLLGPSSVPLHTESDLAGRTSYPFQIDPVLLSFDYPGLDLSEPGFTPDAVHLGGRGLGTPSRADSDLTHLVGNSSSFYRLRASPDVSMHANLPALESSLGPDSPDSSFERSLSLSYTPSTAPEADTTEAATLPFSLSTEFMARSRCGSRYGYRDGPFAVLYPCSADEVGHELGEPFAFSITQHI